MPHNPTEINLGRMPQMKENISFQTLRSPVNISSKIGIGKYVSANMRYAQVKSIFTNRFANDKSQDLELPQ